MHNRSPNLALKFLCFRGTERNFWLLFRLPVNTVYVFIHLLKVKIKAATITRNTRRNGYWIPAFYKHVIHIIGIYDFFTNRLFTWVIN